MSGGRRLGYLSGALRVSTKPDVGAHGPRSHVVGFSRALERGGWDVRPFIVGDTERAQRLAPAGRTEAVQGRWHRKLATDGVRIGAGLLNARRAHQALAGEVDVVYERFASFQALGAAFQQRGIPWVLETSGPFFHEAKVERERLVLQALARRMELRAYLRCDVLVCVSEPLREILVELGVPAERTYVLPNGVDPDRFALNGHIPPETDDLTVGYVGSLLGWQGVETLVDAVGVARGRGVPVRAIIVGDGTNRPGLEARAHRAGVAAHVGFAGRQPPDAVPGLIAGFDLGFSGHLPLLAGRMYHSPLKLYEYLAMGKPLVAADHPEARGLVEGAGAGFLFPPGDVEALAEVLARAAQEVRTLRGHAADVRAYVVAHHSWDRRVRDFSAELERRGL